MTITDIFDTMNYGPAPESAQAALDWLERHERSFGLFINGEWVEASKPIEIKNPANGEKLADIGDASAAEVDKAVAAARAAFDSWQKNSDHERARYLYSIARAIQRYSRLFAVLETMDNGKPIRESRDLDIPLAARHFYHHAGWAQLMSQEMPGYKPLGVIGQVIPWNFPLLMLAWKIAPALAMGNTVVLKPAPFTPLTALLFAEIVAEAGLPPGVVNIVTGGDESGAAITNHDDIDKIAFTGSTEVGKIIRRVTAGKGIKLSLELGGKSPFIVFDDADQDAAIEGLVDAIWFNQGEVCCAGSRLLVQETIAEGFEARLKERMKKLRVGDPLDKGIDMGAIVDPIQHQRIEAWVQQGVAEGANLYRPDYDLPAGGCYYPPTLLTGVQAADIIAQEEIFGPVLVSMTFRTPSEAAELANNTRYGLAASIWSESVNLALDVAQKVKAGSVWVNCTNLFDAASGFGGYRESGFGREGGREGLYEYVKPAWQKHPRPEFNPDTSWAAVPAPIPAPINGKQTANGLLDRTAKLYYGGKQKRPDGGYSRPIKTPDGQFIGDVSEGNRKDIRNAVEAANKAQAGWAAKTAHNRAQILYYIAENLSARRDEFADRITRMTGKSAKDSLAEVDAAISRLFTYGAYADKYGGSIQETVLRGIVIAQNEAIGVIGIACPNDYPLLGFVSLMAPAICRGNTVVLIPSEKYPLSATDFYQILETSDVPAGVVNIVTGGRDALSKTLAEHDDVEAMWYCGSADGSYLVEKASADNMKQTWVNYGVERDWLSIEQSEGEAFLRRATQVKNIWVPTGA